MGFENVVWLWTRTLWVRVISFGQDVSLAISDSRIVGEDEVESGVLSLV